MVRQMFVFNRQHFKLVSGVKNSESGIKGFVVYVQTSFGWHRPALDFPDYPNWFSKKPEAIAFMKDLSSRRVIDYGS